MTTSEVIRFTLAWLGTYALHSTLFLGGAWALCSLRAPRALRNRERLWKLALLGGLVSASIQLGLDARPLLGRIDWSAGTPVAAHAPRVDPLPRTPALETPPDPVTALESEPEPQADAQPLEPRTGGEALLALSPDAGRDPAEHETQGRVSIGPSVDAALHPRPAPGLAADRQARRTDSSPTIESRIDQTRPTLLARLGGALRSRAGSDSWPQLVFLGWTGIGILGLLGVAGSWACLRRALLGRTELRDGPLVACLAELCRRTGVRTRVRLSVSARISSPFSTGILRPEICLPAAVLTDLSAEQQQALLAHELAHTVRRDPAWFGAYFLIEKLFFFQPLNRLARAELSELAELACDDHAVRWTGERLALASCLTHVAGWILGERSRAMTLPGLAGHRSRLGRRIERLLDDRRSPSGDPRARWCLPLAAGSLALVSLAVPGISAASSRPEKLPPGPQDEQPSKARSSALPEPSPGPSSPAASPPTVVDQSRMLLEAELELLQREIVELHAELELRELHERFAGALERIDARMSELRQQHARARVLLELLPRTNTQPPERR